MKSLFCILLTLITLRLYSQNSECGTKAKGSPIIFTKAQKDSLNSILAINTPYCLKIRVTVFADDNGTNRAASDADIRRQIQNMVNQFQVHNICFLLLDITQINNSDLNSHTVTDVAATDESPELNSFVVAGSMNIFIHNDLPGLNGVAYSLPGTHFSLSGGVVAQPQTGNISTMGHEMGHCLGLYHTFETWQNTKKENVARNGSCLNCTTNGDVLCDTPADDDGGVNGSCVYTGGGTDPCGVTYTPATNNMMGYGFRPCRSIFTGEQATRMKYFLINNATLLSFLAQDVLYFPNVPNSNFGYNTGFWVYAARDYIGLSPFTNNMYNVTGSANQLIVSRVVSLKPGTRLSPSSGRVRITANPYCP